MLYFTLPPPPTHNLARPAAFLPILPTDALSVCGLALLPPFDTIVHPHKNKKMTHEVCSGVFPSKLTHNAF